MSKKAVPVSLAMAVAVAIVATAPAKAAIMTNVATDQAPGGEPFHTPYSPTAFSASGADLAEGLLASYDGDSTFELSAGVSAWTNGSIDTVYAQGGSGGDDIDHAAYGSVTNDTTATIDLGGLYDLSRVDVYAAWNDLGRDLFSFDLSVSADDVTYSPVTTFLKGNIGDGLPAEPVTHQISITDDAGDLAAGVRYLRLGIYDTDNGAAGIAEIDVFGRPVPEPTAAGLLLALGSTCLASRRRLG